MIPPPVYPGVPLGPARCQHCGALLTTVPAGAPVPGQLTQAERDALAQRIGNLSEAVDEARGPHDDQVIAPAPVKDAAPKKTHESWRDREPLL